MDVDALKSELGCKTLAELARRLGVSGSYIHDLRAGRRGVTLRMAAAVERETGRTDVLRRVIEMRTAA